MTISNQIDQTMKRTEQYWYEDGFQDMAFGGFLLVIALLFAVQALTAPRSPLWLVWGVGGPLVLLSGAIVVGRVVRRLKERVTYPRTGYVAYVKPRGKSRFFRMAAVFVVAASVSTAFIVVTRNWLSLPVIVGVVYMAAFSFLAYRLSLTRYLLLALVCLAIGVALAPLALSLEVAGAVYHIAAGAACLATGWVTWRRYNHDAPKSESGDGSLS
jgi:hypothetical protein